MRISLISFEPDLLALSTVPSDRFDDNCSFAFTLTANLPKECANLFNHQTFPFVFLRLYVVSPIQIANAPTTMTMDAPMNSMNITPIRSSTVLLLEFGGGKSSGVVNASGGSKYLGVVLWC